MFWLMVTLGFPLGMGLGWLTGIAARPRHAVRRPALQGVVIPPRKAIGR